MYAMFKLLKSGLKVSEVNVCRARGFHCCASLLSKQSIRQRWVKNTERCLKKSEKLLAGDDAKTRKSKGNFSYCTPGTSSVGQFATGVTNERLARHLSRMLSDTITGMVSNAELCPELSELGFKIDNVKVEADLSAVNITWVARGDSMDQQIIALLPTFASQLRSSLMSQKLMWQVPPIHFIVDNTAQQMPEVEELLKVADMGEDFVPTSLGSNLKSPPRQRVEPKMSRGSDAEGLGEVPGPGGSIELVTSRTVDHEPSFAQRSNTWNAACEDRQPLSTAEGTLDDDIDAYSSFADEKTDNVHSNSKNKKFGPEIADIRSDVYGLDHARLWQEVLLAKRKSVNRWYGLSEEISTQFAAASDSEKTHSKRDTAARSKMLKRSKHGRQRRVPDYYLSCHYHNNPEDYED